MLKDNELQRLIRQAQGPDPQARKEAMDIIIENNLNLVRSIIARFGGRGYEWEDLFQVGSIGLLKAAERFDLSLNLKFSTYAVPMIIGEIKRFLRDDNPIKVSRSVKELSLKIYKMREILGKQMGREPLISEIAQELAVPAEDIAAALEAMQPQVSLYESVFNDDKGGSEMYVLDKIKDLETKGADFLDKIALKEALVKLPDRERTVIFLRFFADKTQPDIAKTLGVSQVQISRIEKNALKLIRGGLSENSETL